MPLPSFTRLDRFTRCPMEYAQDVFHGQFRSSAAMLRGTHVHDTLEATAKHFIKTKTSWRECADYVLATPPEGPLPQAELESYVNRALVVLEDCEPIHAEAWFDDIGHTFGWTPLPIRGKIDLLAQDSCSPLIHDYKTIGRPDKVKAPWLAKRSMQLKLYCLASGARRAGFLYLLPGFHHPATSVMVEFSEEELRLAYVWCDKMLQAMLDCWSRFLGTEAHWTMPVTEEQVQNGNWRAWGLASPDDFLCSPKWCDHWGRCLGATQSTGD